jgi:hypothetical protein
MYVSMKAAESSPPKASLGVNPKTCSNFVTR